jgi:hypothetical protein
MSTQTYSSVALDVVGQYQLAGKHLVRAYTTGVDKVARAIDERFAAAVQARELPLVGEAVKSSLIEAQQKVSGFVVGGLRAGSHRVDAANDQLASGVKGGIERLVGAANRIDAALDSKTGDTVALFGLPSAQFSLAVASAIAEGAKRLEERVSAEGGDVAEVEVETVPVQRAKRAARRA